MWTSVSRERGGTFSQSMVAANVLDSGTQIDVSCPRTNAWTIARSISPIVFWLRPIFRACLSLAMMSRAISRNCARISDEGFETLGIRLAFSILSFVLSPLTVEQCNRVSITNVRSRDCRSLRPTPLSMANPLADPKPPSINPLRVRYALRAATAAAPSW